ADFTEQTRSGIGWARRRKKGFCERWLQKTEGTFAGRSRRENQSYSVKISDHRTQEGLMRKLILLFLLCATTVFAAPQTMRLDYYHTGSFTQEIFSMDRVVIEPLPWPGDPNHAIDDTNLGRFFFEVRDQKTDQVLYSRGYATVYGEWELTDEAKKITR